MVYYFITFLLKMNLSLGPLWKPLCRCYSGLPRDGLTHMHTHIRNLMQWLGFCISMAEDGWVHTKSSVVSKAIRVVQQGESHNYHNRTPCATLSRVVRTRCWQLWSDADCSDQKVELRSTSGVGQVCSESHRRLRQQPLTPTKNEHEHFRRSIGFGVNTSLMSL